MAALISVETMEAASPSFADLSDAEQTRRLAAATAAIENYVGRPLARATRTETHRPESSWRIYLRAIPVESVTSVVAGRTGSTTTLDADQYSVDAETGVLEVYRSFYGGYRYPDRVYGSDPRAGNVVVTYVGGYDTDEAPADITQAAILATLATTETLSLSGGGLYASEQLGSYSYRISSSSENTSMSSSGLPMTAAALLRSYRRPRFA
jgi:hypothetical protein